jgi:type IV fimbrial biogenesis protein FimT
VSNREGASGVKSERGIGLIELMVVVGVMALVATLGVESLSGMLARSQGRAAATELAGELRAARSHAMLRRERVRVLFEPENSAVRVESADQPGTMLRSLSLRERGVSIEDVSGGPAILFQPSGRTATPTTVTLRNRRGARWRLTVTITGRVTIQ